MKIYNWYIIQDIHLDGSNGAYHIAQYYGREKSFECCVCNKGHNAFCFNIYYGQDAYETWSYGREHMPKIIKELGKSDKQIFDTKENIEMLLKEVK